jgi:hypothetical protein
MLDHIQNGNIRNMWPTVFPIVQDFEVLLGADGQRLLDHGDGVLRGEGAVEKLAHGGSLHNLGTTEPRETTETVRAIDDMAQAMLSVGHEETAICNRECKPEARQPRDLGLLDPEANKAAQLTWKFGVGSCWLRLKLTESSVGDFRTVFSADARWDAISLGQQQ